MEIVKIVKRVDSWGRILIPKEIRKIMQIKEGDLLRFFIGNNMACFTKYEPSEEEEEKEIIRKYVEQNRRRILSAFFDGDITTVIFENGKKVSVKKKSTDEFDLTMAIYYAMLKAGYEGVE